MNKRAKLLRRRKQISSRLRGNTQMPRLCVFRSSKFVYAQLVDDVEGKTILGVTEKHIEKPVTDGTNRRIDIAKQLGSLIAKKAIEKKITKVVFDRRGYSYHGIVKAVAEGAREGGLQF